jgi:protein-S-isoprenylcysteine O-methyltransferase Ste14
VRSAPHGPWWKGERGEWYVVVQAILFVLIGFGPRSWPGAPEWPQPLATIATWLGLLLMLVGGALAVGGLIALGQRNLTALPYPKEGASLVERGPYAIVRNPIYSGLIFGAFGWGMWLHAPITLLFAAALFVLFDLKSRKEESWLIERFPEYLEYCARVKKLIPWVY